MQKVVFEEHEVRMLQSLLIDYKMVIGKYGFSTDSIKSSYLKEILQHEFGESLRFHTHPQKKHSDFVYGTPADEMRTFIALHIMMENGCYKPHYEAYWYGRNKDFVTYTPGFWEVMDRALWTYLRIADEQDPTLD